MKSAVVFCAIAGFFTSCTIAVGLAALLTDFWLHQPNLANLGLFKFCSHLLISTCTEYRLLVNEVAFIVLMVGLSIIFVSTILFMIGFSINKKWLRVVSIVFYTFGVLCMFAPPVVFTVLSGLLPVTGPWGYSYILSWVAGGTSLMAFIFYIVTDVTKKG
ncbi:uncharacterized protein LOC143465762 [Clavelina lepadiformis]|uniref:uncharacterized protein LOC143465762 n=1 Tax=Clavelina lepadiformis TaxID=159417 RepID=UPI0040414D7B